MLTVHDATEQDAEFIAANMREADRAEVAAGGSDPLAALLEGIEHSLNPYVFLNDDGTPVCMFGVGPSPDPLVGCVWLLGTDDVKRRAVSLSHLIEPILTRFHGSYPVLMNCVDERNALHIRWLKRQGFVFLRRLPIGVGGLPFLEFVRLRHV